MAVKPEYRAKQTGKVRFRLHEQKWVGDPLLILQLEETFDKREWNPYYERWKEWYFDATKFRDATLEDLSVMNIKNLSISREGGEMPACFRPYRPWGRGWMLVLQTLNGAVLSNSWRDAKLQDLLFKDGNFLGGVGLIAR